MNKPKFNQTIYVLYNDLSLTKEKVYLKGETEFCHSDAFNTEYLDSFREPLKYTDKDKTWFTSLSSAKRYFKKVLKYKNIIELQKDYWEGTD